MSTQTHRSFASVVVDVVCLVLVFLLAYGAMMYAPHVKGELALIGAVGFLLLSGTLTSKILDIVRIPHLTGYLLAGLVAGPHVLHVIDHETVTRLQPVNTLALALIALAGGAEINLEDIKRGFKGLAISMLVQSVSVVVIVSAVFVLAARSLISFTAGFSISAIIGIALLWGVVAVSRSPSATLAILSQTRARGPITSYTLGFVMSSDVVVVILLAAVTAIARPLLDPSATVSFAAFKTLGHEILGSVALGTTLGLVLSVYLRLVGKQLLVVLVALGFGATETLRYLNFEPLLTFLVAGFIVRNLSRQGEKFLHAIEGTGAVVYVVFFASAGAHLDLPLLKQLWVVALLLAGSRALVTWVAARVSSRLANDPPVLRTWAWAPLISQAGLTLGLSAMIARDFPAFGAGFRALAIATVAINEMVGPILFKLALDRNGESRAEATLAEIAEAEG